MGRKSNLKWHKKALKWAIKFKTFKQPTVYILPAWFNHPKFQRAYARVRQSSVRILNGGD